jgi:pimeloyl-ACP methyl ester carboxylesterase
MKLVLIHGSGGCGEVWYYQKQKFPDVDALDLPGHPEGELRASVEEYADWLHSYVVEKGYQQIVLGGHSLGGGIALTHALKYPQDLRALILFGSGARLRVLPSIIESIRAKLNDPDDWMKKLVEPLYGGVGEEARSVILRKLARVGPAAQLNDFLCCDKFDIMGSLAEIRMPALAIVGEHDNMTPLKYSQYLVKNMPACRMVVIEGAGHPAMLEEPQAVNQAIQGFLTELGK